MEPASPPAAWSTYDVAELTGASCRQVDYWTRTTPVLQHHASGGSGSRRRWTDDEVRRVDLIVRLRKTNVDLDTARASASGTVGDPVVVSVTTGVSLIVEWRTIEEIEEGAADLGVRVPVHVSGRNYRPPTRRA